MEVLRGMLQTRMNLECAVTDEMIGNALRVKPHDICLVPEKREELTTEGGLDVVRYFDAIQAACAALCRCGYSRVAVHRCGRKADRCGARTGAPVVEIHTGKYADADSVPERERELERIRSAAVHAHALGLQVNAGHGLNYHNVRPSSRSRISSNSTSATPSFPRRCSSGWKRR